MKGARGAGKADERSVETRKAYPYSVAVEAVACTTIVSYYVFHAH